jgi:hypothetical protein
MSDKTENLPPSNVYLEYLDYFAAISPQISCGIYQSVNICLYRILSSDVRIILNYAGRDLVALVVLKL